MTENLLMFLHMVPLFRSLRYEELVELSSKLKEKDFYKGEILAEEGKAGGEALYIIESGHLSVLGKEGDRVLATLSRYNFFGEVSLLTGEPHSATIKASTDGKLFVLEKRDFEELEQKNASVVLGLSKTLSYKLRSVVDGRARAERKVKVVLVVSALPKTGGSVLSANLAASIAKQTEARTLLLDLNLVPGSSSTILKITPSETLGSRCQARGSIELSDVQELSFAHPSGFKVLTVAREETVDSRLLFALKEIVALQFDYVIVDVSPKSIAVIEEVFRFGDQILFLLPDKKSEINRSLEFLEDLIKADPKVKEKVLRGGICKAGDQPQYAAPKFDFYLCFEEEPLDSFLISGEPFVLTHFRSKIAKRIDGLARRVCDRRLGLALSSGMAQGLAHVGVLKVFEKENISVDLMAGTSGGAVYGSAFAAGIPMQKVEEVLKKKVGRLLWFYIDFTFPYSGVVAGRKLKALFESVIGSRTFLDLEIPFKVVASDLHSGEIVVLEQGRVGAALRASFAIPGIFTPYRYKGEFLTDGATVSPVPVEVLYQSGADLVVAVNVNTNPRLMVREKEARRRKKESGLVQKIREIFSTPFIVDVIMSSRAMTSYKLSEFDAAKADLVIQPRVERFHWRDYGSATQIIAEGEKAAYEAIPRIKKMLKH